MFVKLDRAIAEKAFEALGWQSLKDAIEAAPVYSGTLDSLRALAEAGGRPICGLDIEATGTNPVSDRIIELSIVKVWPYNWPNREKCKYTAETYLLNPGVPIPADATEVHGITDADVADEAPFGAIATDVLAFLTGCDVLTFNGNRFDIPMLCQHFDECELDWPAQGTRQYDGSVLFRNEFPRTLTAAIAEYTGREPDETHRAEADTIETLHVFAAQLERSLDLSMMTPDALHEHCQGGRKAIDVAGKLVLNDEGEVVFNFGTHKGKTLKSEVGYAQWILRSDFPRNTKKHIERLLGFN